MVTIEVTQHGIKLLLSDAGLEYVLRVQQEIRSNELERSSKTTS